jgi:OmpA family
MTFACLTVWRPPSGGRSRLIRYDERLNHVRWKAAAPHGCLAKRLRENPALVVELEVYADSAGAPPYNLRLSQLRAEAVGRFLAEQGVLRLLDPS